MTADERKALLEDRRPGWVQRRFDARDAMTPMEVVAFDLQDAIGHQVRLGGGMCPVDTDTLAFSIATATAEALVKVIDHLNSGAKS